MFYFHKKRDLSRKRKISRESYETKTKHLPNRDLEREDLHCFIDIPLPSLAAGDRTYLGRSLVVKGTPILLSILDHTAGLYLFSLLYSAEDKSPPQDVNQGLLFWHHVPRLLIKLKRKDTHESRQLSYSFRKPVGTISEEEAATWIML